MTDLKVSMLSTSFSSLGQLVEAICLFLMHAFASWSAFLEEHRCRRLLRSCRRFQCRDFAIMTVVISRLSCDVVFKWTHVVFAVEATKVIFEGSLLRSGCNGEGRKIGAIQINLSSVFLALVSSFFWLDTYLFTCKNFPPNGDCDMTGSFNFPISIEFWH